VLAKFVTVCDNEVSKLNFTILAEYCTDFKAVVTFRFDVLLYNERFVFDLDDLI
jgi:hypothetical protein